LQTDHPFLEKRISGIPQRQGEATMNTENILKDDLNEELWLFHIAFRALTRLPDAELARHGLSRIHNRILFVIARAGEVSVGGIADTLAISRQALHGPMRQLREAGFIASRPSSENRTVQLVSLTAQGQQLEFRINELQREHLRLAFNTAGKNGTAGWKKVMHAVSEITPTES